MILLSLAHKIIWLVVHVFVLFNLFSIVPRIESQTLTTHLLDVSNWSISWVLVNTKWFNWLPNHGGFLAHVRKTAIKAVWFTQIAWNFVQQIFELYKNCNISHMIKMITSAFLWRHHLTPIFLSYFQNFPLPKINCFLKKNNELNLY